MYSALAVFLMVADTRFHITAPLRQAVAVVIYPLQWLMLRPVEFVGRGAGYFQSLQSAQDEAQQLREKMALLSQRASEADLLVLENERLRQLLDLGARLQTSSRAAEVIYDAADPYSRRVVVNRGQVQGVAPGSPVLDEGGVLGQVTRVQPFTSEVTLLVDADQAIPVLNVRTGARSVAYGDPVSGSEGGMELRFTSANADVQEGDLLTTSGVDGVYPPGLPVARIVRIERQADSAFARIYCAPLAQVQGARHVLLLKPLSDQIAARPQAESAPSARASGKKGGRP